MRSQEEKHLYEVGYHLSSSIGEDAILEESQKVRDTITGVGGVITSEGTPKSFLLAYTVYKKVGGKNEKHDSSYFGWFRFETEPNKAEIIREKMKDTGSVIRYIVVKVQAEKAVPVKSRRSSVFSKTPKKEMAKPKDKTSSKELDEEIEKLVLE